MADVTLFKALSIPICDLPLSVILKDIITGKYQNEVEKIRSLFLMGDNETGQEKKKLLMAFTPSATFDQRRLYTNINQYNGVVHLDFDNISEDMFELVFELITLLPYTLACFRSPSGNGIKVFIEVTSTKVDHLFAYKQVTKYYETKTGLITDEKCKDITRLCFVSYDPLAFINHKPQKFEVKLPCGNSVNSIGLPVIQPIKNVSDYLPDLQECLKFTEQKKQNLKGNRNEFVYTFASNCNRKGIIDTVAIDFIKSHSDLPEKEINQAFNSAYTHHKEEFAKFANLAMLQNSIEPQSEFEEDPFEDNLKNTPTIPEEVFEVLPHILKEGVKAFTDKRKRDVFLSGAIAILSGCLPNVTGVYFQEIVYPHLYVFIIAPAASGKGVLKNAKKLAEKYHQKILQQSKEAQKDYENELIHFKQKERNLKNGEKNQEKPIAPPFKIVIIPADCSKARMIEHLKSNEGQGIICETEADTMSGAKNQDWGDYSTILRAAFHHETISSTRKTDNQFDEINDPRLAVALSGTPAQAPRLLSSAEDGLFSRFLFYAYKNEIKWQDPSPKEIALVYNDHFEALSIKVLEMVQFLEHSPTTIELTSSQWQQINTDFSKMLSEVVTFTSEDAIGVVFRLGTIFYRLCMIFTAMRKFENAELTSRIYCTDEDFNAVKKIIKTYLDHSLLMFNNLPKQNESFHFKAGGAKRNFFDALPKEFARKEAIEIGKKFKLSPRTVDEVLRSSNELSKIKSGYYQRL